MCKKLYEGERAEVFLSLFDEDTTLQKIAKYRFVDGLTISEVAMLVGYCERQIDRFCKKIREIAEVKLGWQSAVMNTFLGGKV